MFNHLVESGSHKTDMARRGRFFLGTLGLYGLLLMLAGVASVFAYDTHLAQQNLELYTFVAPLPLEAETERPNEPARPAAGDHRNQLAERPEAIARLMESVRPPDTISTQRNPVAEMPRILFTITDRTVDPDNGGGIGPIPGAGGVHGTNRNAAVVVPVDPADTPPPPRVTPTPTPVKPTEQVRLSSVVISSKIIDKPAPAYPALAKQAHVQGPVTVEILINEQGRVVSAQATTGHPLLRAAAQASAYQAHFSPTSISGHPVKVSGVITYNFILQ